jgi:putative ABC transport system permease protein
LRITTPSGFWGAQIPTSFEIVGVAGNVKFLGLNADSAPAYYLPDKQFPQQSMSLLARTSGDPLASAAALRQAVLSVDHAQPIGAIRTLESLMTAQTARARFNTVLMGLFGAVALALAMLGVFGLLSYQVTQQAGEFGLRMALGAQPGDVLRLVIRQGLNPVIAGAGCGLLGAFALTRLMTALLFGVGATDLPTFVGVALLLSSVAFLACWIPARRAAKVDPMIALRRE